MALDLIVTVVAAGLTLIAAVAGICGMNLAPLPVQDSNVRPLIFVGHSQMTCRLMKAVVDPTTQLSKWQACILVGNCHLL